MKNVVLTGTHVLLKMVPKEEMRNGFYMPDSNRAENQKGIIVEVADQCKLSKHVNDQVVFVKPNVGYEVDMTEAGLEGTYKVVDESDVLVVIY